MENDIGWSATRSGPLAQRAKLRMDDAIRRWKAETHPQLRVNILLEYTALMTEWLDHVRAHLRELDEAPLMRRMEPAPDARAEL